MMNRLLYILLLLGLLLTSCAEDEPIMVDEPQPVEDTFSMLSEYDRSVIIYFESIALGFEFGNASAVVRKWQEPLKYHLLGEKNATLEAELESIITEITELTEGRMVVEPAPDSASANYYIFLGKGSDYGRLFPSSASFVRSNWGLFNVSWDSALNLNYGRMYVDTHRASLDGQKHLLREEFTQSLGLAKDSNVHNRSIFYGPWTMTTSYARIDRDLIRLLYHPDITSGDNATVVRQKLVKILTEG